MNIFCRFIFLSRNNIALQFVQVVYVNYFVEKLSFEKKKKGEICDRPKGKLLSVNGTVEIERKLCDNCKKSQSSV